MRSTASPLICLSIVVAGLIAVVPAAGSEECLELIASIPGGPANAIASGVDPDIVYLGLGHWFQTIDVTDPARPSVLSSLMLPWRQYPVEDIEIAGSLAYVSMGMRYHPNGRGALLIIDVSEPSGPVTIGSVEFYDDGGRIALTGDLALVAGKRGLWIFDVADPSQPTEIGLIEPFGAADDVAASGDLAFVTNRPTFPSNNDPGVNVIDLSDPTAPAIIGRLVTPFLGLEVEISGGFLFLAAADSGLRVVDVRVPTSPTEIGNLDTPGSAAGLSLADERGTIAIADDSGGMRIADISVPSSPVEIGAFVAVDSVSDVAVSGDRAFLRSSKGAPHVIDISNLTAPTEQGWMTESPTGNRDIAVTGTVAATITRGYVSPRGLQLYDVRDPRNPNAAGFVELNQPTGVEVVGHHAYVRSSDGLHTFDISTPAVPVQVDLLQLPPTGYQLDRSASLLVATTQSGSNAIQLIDISEPEEPRIVGDLDLSPHSIISLSIDGDLVSILDDEKTLRLVDVSVPAAPVEIGEYALLSYYMSYDLVDVYDSVAYVSGTYVLTSSRSVSVIDAVNPASPVLSGWHAANSGWYEVDDGFAIDTGYWVSLISTVPVTQSTVVAPYFGAGNPDQCVRSGKYIYLSSAGSALDILYDCSVFADGFDFGRTTAWSDVVE